MRFQEIGGLLVNLDQVESIGCFNNDSCDSSGKVPMVEHEIHLEMASGKVLKLQFDKDFERDKKYSDITRALTA